MNQNNDKTTVLVSSVSADEEQPLALNNNIIHEDDENYNDNFKNIFKEMNHPYYLHTISMSKLYDTAYTPKKPVIENLLYGGTYLFVGAPKIGKSFLMAQLAYHVSSGINLWDNKVHKGTVLYLALEDDYARLQQRLSRMFDMEENANFHLATQSNQLNGGLDKQLEYFISKHEDTRLIIIDTLQKIREIDGVKFNYASDYDIVTKLKNFSDNNGVCLLLVHHTRKQAADDCFETISGTNGLLGAADGAFVLQKEKRTDLKAVLDIVGRDQQDQRLHLIFDQEHCIWLLTKAETELWKKPSDPVLDAIAAIITAEQSEWNGTPSELVIKLGLNMKPNILTKRLNVNAGRLQNEYGIYYENDRNHDGRNIKLSLDISMT